MLLDMVADAAGERVVLGSLAGGMTASGLRDAARGAARSFLAANAEHVVLLDLNSDAVPVALFGAALAGLPFAPVNYRLIDDQLRPILSRLAPCVVVAGASTVGRVRGVEGL